MLSLWFLCAFPAHGSDALTIDADSQFKLAETAYQQNEFELSIVEFNRFIFFFPTDDRIPEARYKIGLAYFHSAQFKKAIGRFNELINKHEDSRFSDDAYFMISRSYLRLEMKGQAISALHNLAVLSDDITVSDRAYNSIAWIETEEMKFDSAAKSFARISPENRNSYNIPQIEEALGQMNELPRKNPATAGALSILPGAGQLYCGRYKDALMAFIINGGLIWATVEAFEDENYALGSVIGAVELGFYTGNIYSARSSAHKFNRHQTQRFIEALKQNLKVGIAPGPDRKGIVLGLQYQF